MKLTDEELAALSRDVAQQAAQMVIADGNAVTRALMELIELRALLATPMPASGQFEIVPLADGLYLKCCDEDGISDMDYDTAIGVGASIMRAARAAKEGK